MNENPDRLPSEYQWSWHQQLSRGQGYFLFYSLAIF